jgi:hypothetical protein
MMTLLSDNAILVAVAAALLMLTSLFMHDLWLAVFKARPSYGIFSIAALLASLLLTAIGISATQGFSGLSDEFIESLPAPTRLLVKYGYLLMGVLILFLAASYLLRKNTRRERYFAIIMAGEVLLLTLALVCWLNVSEEAAQ